jgi:hypothetical protein
VARELRGRRSQFPRGTVTLTAPDTLAQDLYLAEATAGRFLLHGMSVAIDMSEGGS